MQDIDTAYWNREHWIASTDFYKRPYLRLEKCARILNRLAGSRATDLLDIGCGPATLARHLNGNIRYHGIDIAIHEPAANLIEMDVTQEPIRFRNKRFDLIVAAGLFEYLGTFHRQKLWEIHGLLKERGRLVVTFTNFAHVHPPLQEPTYNNAMSIRAFLDDLRAFFRVERYFPSSHNWVRREPKRRWLYWMNMRFSANIPFVSRLLACNYFFICSHKRAFERHRK
jgi:SAM-dependent methyltransferase